ncbi:hypothetical protein TNCV_4880861 [Trichonephila clavipes]|nr:hypothetical protein TNCV_4880861 [Trichonephila clavipes]
MQGSLFDSFCINAAIVEKDGFVKNILAVVSNSGPQRWSNCFTVTSDSDPYLVWKKWRTHYAAQNVQSVVGMTKAG